MEWLGWEGTLKFKGTMGRDTSHHAHRQCSAGYQPQISLHTAMAICSPSTGGQKPLSRAFSQPDFGTFPQPDPLWLPALPSVWASHPSLAPSPTGRRWGRAGGMKKLCRHPEVPQGARRRLPHRWEVFQHLPVLLLALRVLPVWLVEVGVELVQHRDLDIQRNAHVILYSVQGTENQVEYTDCMPGRGEKPAILYLGVPVRLGLSTEPSAGAL